MGLDSFERREYGPKGLGTISILPKSAVNTPAKWKEIKISINVNGQRRIYNDFDPETVNREFGDWKLKPMAREQSVHIELTYDETNIKTIKAPDGTYIFQFSHLAGRQNEDGSRMAPSIKSKPMKAVNTRKGGVWIIPSHDEFYAIHKLVSSEIGKKTPYNGMEQLQTLWYMFERNPETGLVQTVFATGETSTKMFHDELMNFLTYTGYDFDADNLMPSENVLSELEPILQGREEFYRATIANGYIIRDGLFEPPTGLSL